jgi:arsenite methyltransferase
MLERAKQNKEKAGADNVVFIESPITEIALPSAIADCVISNCVINLVPEQEKQLCFNEIYRLLKPGGRLAISDILLKKELPAKLKQSISLYVGCISGASKAIGYEKYLHNAGFSGECLLKSCHQSSRKLAANVDVVEKMPCLWITGMI